MRENLEHVSTGKEKIAVEIVAGLLLIILMNYLIITNIVDIILLGAFSFRFSTGCHTEQFVITKENRIDMQKGFQCSAFSTAYVLRHFDKEVDGGTLYSVMPHKMKSGYVYPKGVYDMLRSYGMKVKYCRGNLNALKVDLQKGNPVIVMIRVQKDKDWLHYVPVVGFDEEHVFLAESLSELINCKNVLYNRRLRNEEFLQLWNTAMLKQPFYKNTYFVAKSKSETAL